MQQIWLTATVHVKSPVLPGEGNVGSEVSAGLRKALIEQMLAGVLREGESVTVDYTDPEPIDEDLLLALKQSSQVFNEKLIAALGLGAA